VGGGFISGSFRGRLAILGSDGEGAGGSVCLPWFLKSQ